jgi:hypothetical protein
MNKKSSRPIDIVLSSTPDTGFNTFSDMIRNDDIMFTSSSPEEEQIKKHFNSVETPQFIPLGKEEDGDTNHNKLPQTHSFSLSYPPFDADGELQFTLDEYFTQPSSIRNSSSIKK